jgi:hypothetical protein
MKLFGCMLGATKACHETSRCSSEGVAGRMAIVLHNEPLTGEGAMESCGAGCSARVD